MAKAPQSLAIFGCGYLGTQVALKAIKLGWQVSALTRNEEQARLLQSYGLHHVVVDCLDADSWHVQIPPHQDYVLNCVSSAGGGLDGYRKSYLEGQASILRWASLGHIGSMIYTSSTSVYPQSDASLVDEDSPTTGLSPSGEVLLQSEKLLMQAPAASINRWFILRLAGIYGPERHYLLDAVRRGERTLPGSGDFFLNLIHRDDCVSAIFSLFATNSQFRNRIYNLVDDTRATKAEIVGWLAEKLSVPAPAFDPSLTREREGRRRGRDGSFPNRVVNNRRIREEIGWRPQYPSFREGYTASGLLRP